MSSDIDKSRAEALREGLEQLVAATRLARQEGRPTDVIRCRNLAIQLMLDYIGNGYYSLLWAEIEGAASRGR